VPPDVGSKTGFHSRGDPEGTPRKSQLLWKVEREIRQQSQENELNEAVKSDWSIRLAQAHQLPWASISRALLVSLRQTRMGNTLSSLSTRAMKAGRGCNILLQSSG
jgi:hypothetical protein